MRISKQKSPKSSRRGFTLIELLVAVSLFSIAVAIAAGGFVRALRTQRQLIALISANSSASLAIEQMSREIRTGYDFNCVAPGGICNELIFVNADGERVAYLAEDGVLGRRTGSAVAFQPLTPENAEVRKLSFFILDDTNYPPRITIVMSVTARVQELGDSLTNLQTTISSRNF